MVVIDVSLSSLFFFMLGFFAAVAMIVLLAIVWVLFPKLSEAKRFFDFWRKINEKDNKKV